MKIRWLNSDCTEAILEGGMWWWKRVAHVKRKRDPDARVHERWYFHPSGREFNSYELETRRALEIARRADDADWHRPVDLPAARLLQEGES